MDRHRAGSGGLHGHDVEVGAATVGVDILDVVGERLWLPSTCPGSSALLAALAHGSVAEPASSSEKGLAMTEKTRVLDLRRERCPV